MKRNLVLPFLLGLFVSILGITLINYVFINLLSFSHTAYFLDALLSAFISFWLFRYTEENKYRMLIVILACTPFCFLALLAIYNFFYTHDSSYTIWSLSRSTIVIFVVVVLLRLLQLSKRVFFGVSASIFITLFSSDYLMGKYEFSNEIKIHPMHTQQHSISNIYRDSVFSTNKGNVDLLEKIHYKKHIVLTFSSYICSPCIRLKKNLLSISPESIDNALVINVLTVKDSSTYVKYINRYPNVDDRYITILDSDSALYKSFKVEYFPQTYLVDKQGNIAWWFAGFSTNDNLWFADELKRRIAALPD